MSFGVIFIIICVVMMVGMMRHGHRSGTHASHARGPGEAARILADRLARGEIDIEEYERRLAVLQRTNELDAT
jgi:uncharacterized membrane protein